MDIKVRVPIAQSGRFLEFVPDLNDANMVNLTDLWRKFGSVANKDPRQWVRKEGKALVESVANNLNVPVWRTTRGKFGGTFAMPEIASRYESYLSIKKPKRSVTVYFVQCSVTKLIKIGMTGNVAKRLSDLRTTSPTPLSLLATLKVKVEKGVQKAERLIHEKFKLLRHHGEWFSPGNNLLTFITAHGVRQKEAHADELE